MLPRQTGLCCEVTMVTNCHRCDDLCAPSTVRPVTSVWLGLTTIVRGSTIVSDYATTRCSWPTSSACCSCSPGGPRTPSSVSGRTLCLPGSQFARPAITRGIPLSHTHTDLFKLYPADHGNFIVRTYHYITVDPWVGYILVSCFIHLTWVYLLLLAQLFQVGGPGPISPSPWLSHYSPSCLCFSYCS